MVVHLDSMKVQIEHQGHCIKVMVTLVKIDYFDCWTPNCSAMTNLGGVPGSCPPWDPILSFSHTFSPKSAHVGGPHPPYGKSWIRH